MEFIDIKKQYQLYQEEIDRSIQEVLRNGSFILGPQVKEIEEVLAGFVGVQHCISVSSGTDSLLIALMGLGIGPGDEVITTPFTWIASAEVIKRVGATPVFVDIDPVTYNIDVNLIETAITPKTRAILPVSIFGQMPDFQKINAIAEKHQIPVIEDGAQSFGATQNGKRSCSTTTIGSTSFFPAKPFGCYGDGGAIFTNDDALASKFRAIRTHGAEKRYEHTVIGINGRFDTIQAAVLLAKFPHFSGELKKRHEIGAKYSEALKDYCITPKIQKGNTHIYAQYTIRTPERDLLSKELQEQGIPNGVYYPKGIHEYPVYADLGYAFGSLPQTEKVTREVISLPMHPWLEEKDQNKIIQAVKMFAEKTSPAVV